jgi:MoaA/NifB/PqqE/SkfB family radical SAM enzyme
MRLSGPLSVLVEVNSACQLRCRYCSAAPFNGSSMPLEPGLAVVKELGSFPVWAITFSGGEPLLHPHIFDFVQASSACSIRPTVNTNGLKLLDEAMLKGLVALQSEGVEFTLSISIDSPEPSLNDSARGRGAEVIEAIRAAVAAGLDVTLSAVVHKQNLDSALLIPEAFPQVRQFRYSPSVTRHLAADVAGKLKVEDELMEQFWQKAAELQKELGEARVLLPFRQTGQEGEAAVIRKEHKTCYCGFTSCVIDSQFNVYPCDWARSPLVKMGNLRQDSLRKIWASKEAEQVRALGSSTRLCQMDPKSESYEQLRDSASKCTA